MNSRYRVTIVNQNIYKEIELSPEMLRIRVGTDSSADVRLRKELFFDPIELEFVKNNGHWSVMCNDAIYLTLGNDVQKYMIKELVHGNELVLHYQSSGYEAFSLSFMLDFDYEKKKYLRSIDISKLTTLSIGNDRSCHIYIASPYVKGDKVLILLDKHPYTIQVVSSQYGIYQNGIKIVGKSKIKNGDFISIGDFSFYIKDRILYTEVSPNIQCTSLAYHDAIDNPTYPLFNRSTRLNRKLNEDAIEVLDPPAKPQEPKNNLLIRLLPSLAMIGTSIGIGLMSGGTMVIFSLVTASIGLITGILGVIQSKRDYKKSVNDRITKYKKYIENKKNEIERIRENERLNLEEIYYSQNREKENYYNFSPDLFDRVKSDDDFMVVRLGTGDILAKREINYKKQEKLEIEDDLQTMPEQLYKDYRYIHAGAVTCDLKSINALGIVGTLQNRIEMMKNIVFDICARHYFNDVKMFFVGREEHKNQLKWLRFLPYVYNDDLQIRNIVVNDESKNILFEYLYKALSLREQEKEHESHYVVFLFDEYGFNNHPISKFVEKAVDLAVTFVFFGENKSSISLGCNYIVQIETENQAKLINSEDINDTIIFEYPHIAMQDMEKIVELLAPVYTQEISLESSLIKNISFFEMLNILSVEDIDLTKNYANSKVFQSMAAPIGVSKNGIIYLDLHDKVHGPHGLVAGTTGSGKSEILQTYILSMAVLFHPYEVSFVIIDFKGGGMVNQFKDLPHLLGAITNIDGKEISRSLKSIKAELKKRQKLFADADVNHIDKYIQKYKKGEVKIPLPHLIVIVDEFAELKAEQPDFMKELISASRIGRSLGVHLILATQKPSGQVDEQIWSNSRFKLCLKVQSATDSNEVLKSPLAAEIKEAGRAYFQVGNNEIFELFQSAYSGASEKVIDSTVKEFSIYELADNGKRIQIYSQKKKLSKQGSLTQLDAIVSYVTNYCSTINLKRLPNICLPSLSEIIDFPSREKLLPKDTNYTSDIGVYDDPDNQYQGVYHISVADSNVMIVGSSQTGKTNLIQVMMRGLAEKYSPKEVTFYVIDFASMILKNFEILCHVGGVVTPSEDEKLNNLFKLLNTEIAIRKDKLMNLGVSSYSAYREAGKTDLPLIVLFIDNLTALKELYFQDNDLLINICREGLTVGISLVIANSQTAGFGYKYLSNISTRLAMYNNDTSEYASLFQQSCPERPSNTPGRMLVSVDKLHLECQSYLAFEGEKEIDRINSIRSFVNRMNDRYVGEKAIPIPVIPKLLSYSNVHTNYQMIKPNTYCSFLGLDYSSIEPLYLNLSSSEPLVVSGGNASGKHNFMKYMVYSLDDYCQNKVDIKIVDSMQKKLEPLSQLESVSLYTYLSDTAVTIIKETESILAKRYETMVHGNIDTLKDENLLVLIINNSESLSAISLDTEALNAYKNITGKYKHMNVWLLFGDYENNTIPFNAPEITRKLKETRHFLFFDDLSNFKIYDLPLALVRNNKKAIEIGDGYYLKGTDCKKIKTVKIP